MKQLSKKVPNSIIFWNIVVALVLGVSFLIDPALGWVFMAFLTVAAFAILLGGNVGREDYLQGHYWIFLSPFVLGFAVLVGILWGAITLGERFNKWLDKKE